jgi:DNA-binding XRE family transcriptional regulator
MKTVKNDWLWDRRITIRQAKKILNDAGDKRFILMASLLLSRKNNPKEVFKEYLGTVLFCKRWPGIKKKMRQDKWGQARVVFWQAIYENLLAKYKEKGIKFRNHNNIAKDALCETTGKEVKRIRLGKKLSQKQLARKMGISQQLVSRIEKGRENISLITLKKISKALGSKVEIIFVA